jgi:ATP-dependent Clp protease adaptor protein ClpS
MSAPSTQNNPQTQTDTKPKPKRQPRYHVVLIDDNDHGFEYVVGMMRQLFGHPQEDGEKIAKTVNAEGRAICLTTSFEHAELKRDQIHAFGPDKTIPECKGAMRAELEPADDGGDQ